MEYYDAHTLSFEVNEHSGDETSRVFNCFLKTRLDPTLFVIFCTQKLVLVHFGCTLVASKSAMGKPNFDCLVQYFLLE